MTAVLLTDEDRKLIAHYRDWSHADLTPTWFFVGAVGVFGTGLVIINALSGAITTAGGLAVLGAIIAYTAVRSARRQVRLGQLIAKLASLAPAGQTEPTTGPTHTP
jgi:hypothetical protein